MAAASAIWRPNGENMRRRESPEYWIVDPELGRITVLALEEAAYVVHGEFARGMVATSRLLPGFKVDVTEALNPKD